MSLFFIVDFGDLAQRVDELDDPAALVIRRLVLVAVGVGGGDPVAHGIVGRSRVSQLINNVIYKNNKRLSRGF